MIQPLPDDAAAWEAAAEAMQNAADTTAQLSGEQVDFTEWALSMEPGAGDAP